MAEIIRSTCTEQTPAKDFSITPEILPPEEKLKWLREQLLRTQEGYLLLHPNNKDLIPPSKRAKRVTMSELEDWIPAVHLLLQDPDFDYDFHFKSRKRKLTERFSTSKFSVKGSALHELFDLTGLINSGKMEPKPIIKSLPNYPEKSLAAHIDTLSDSSGLSLFDIWDKFRTHPALTKFLENENQWIIQEFPEIPLSEELQQELATRRGPEVFEAGCKLIPGFMKENPQLGANTYYETSTLNNWSTLSLEGNTRVQIPQRNDCVYSYMDEEGNIVIKFLEVKTGKIQEDFAHQLQALIMHFNDGHFVDNVMKKGHCPRPRPKNEKEKNNENWYKRKMNYITPVSSNYSLEYLYFDEKTGTVTHIPVLIDYHNPQGKLFLKWLAFYSDAFNALKDKIKYYLQTGDTPQVFPTNNIIYTQNELFSFDGSYTTIYLDNIPPQSKPQPTAYSGPKYKPGEPRTMKVTCPNFRICSEPGCPITKEINITQTVTIDQNGRGILYEEGNCNVFKNKTIEVSKKLLRKDALLKD